MNKKIFSLVLVVFILTVGIGIFQQNIALAGFTYTTMEKIPGTDGNISDFPAYAKAIYKFLIWTIGIAALLMIMIGGFMYMTSAGNNASMGKAKGYITDAIIGLVMAMTAWLILNTIDPNLVNITINFPSGIDGQRSGAQDREDCNKQCSAQGGSETVQNRCVSQCIAKKQQEKGTSGGPGNGSCSPISSGSCSESNLSNSCFGSNAVQASSICNAESRGSQTIHSGTDICADGNPVSFGLFQINISANTIGGLNCPSAFSGGAYTSKNHSCRVTNQELYNQCVNLAKDPSANISKACELSGNGAHWRAWGANSKCGFNR